MLPSSQPKLDKRKGSISEVKDKILSMQTYNIMSKKASMYNTRMRF